MEIGNVLSLFDGMSCGQIALNRADIRYENYFASEIDKHAIKVTQHNYPKTIQLGDVRNIKSLDLPKIDLLIGGSPCQNLSIAVINDMKHNKGLNGEKSSLFYEYLRLLNEVNPKYFILENVGSMKKKDMETISDMVGVNAIRINSNIFSAQNRDRYYWTNINVDLDIYDKGLLLKDVILDSEHIDSKYWYSKDFIYNGDDEKVQATLVMNAHDIVKRVYNINTKCPTLTCCNGGNLQKKVFQNGKCRKLTPTEYERLQTVPEGYTSIVSDSHRYNMLGNGWTVDVIVYILKGISKENTPIPRMFKNEFIF